MNPLELIASLSPAERMDMIIKGFRPGDLRDIKRYRKGERISIQEKEQKVHALTGDFQNLGNSNEKEIFLDISRERIPLEEVQSSSSSANKKAISDYRNQVNEEMDSYSSSVNGKVFNTDDILSFNTQKKQPLKENDKSLQMIANQGFNNAKEYLNAFVLNLQNEDQSKSYNLRLNILKSLKKCLEEEGGYKSNPKELQAYRSGINKAEKTLLEKLQGSK